MTRKQLQKHNPKENQTKNAGTANSYHAERRTQDTARNTRDRITTHCFYMTFDDILDLTAVVVM